MKILVVEDERLARAANIQILRNIGYTELIEASSGTEALQMIRNEAPDLVLADISMPDMSGLELIRTVREEGEDVEFAFLSGYDRFDYAQQAIESRALAYLLKPVDTAELKRTLRRAEDEIREKEDGKAEISILRSRVEQEQKLKLENLTKDVLLDRCGPEKMMISEFYACGVSFPWQSWGVLVFRILHPGPGWGGADMPLLLYGMENIAKELLESYDVVSSGVVMRNDLCILLHFRSQAQQQEKAGSMEEEIGWKFNQVFGCSVVSELRFSPTLTGCGEAYQSAIEGLGRTERFSVAEQTSGELLDILREQSLRELSGAMGTGDRAAAERVIASFFALPQLGGGVLLRQKLCLYIDVFLACAAEESFCIQKDLTPERDRFRETSLLRDQAEATAWCLGVFDSYAAGREEQRDSFTQAAAAYIHEHYAEAISLGIVAGRFHYTDSYFSRVFCESMGKGFSTYLKQYRILRSKLLLLGTDWKTRDIGQRVGYPDAKYFSSVFQKTVGMQPNVYRALGRKNKTDREEK